MFNLSINTVIYTCIFDHNCSLIQRALGDPSLWGKIRNKKPV